MGASPPADLCSRMCILSPYIVTTVNTFFIQSHTMRSPHIIHFWSHRAPCEHYSLAYCHPNGIATVCKFLD